MFESSDETMEENIVHKNDQMRVASVFIRLVSLLVDKFYVANKCDSISNYPDKTNGGGNLDICHIKFINDY